MRPPNFAYWAPAEMAAQAHAMIPVCGLAWNVTDNDQNRFDELGFFLFTQRNGSKQDLAAGASMRYAEKLLIIRKSQLLPMHRHIKKAEDIVNRGGAKQVLELFASTSDGSICSDSKFSMPGAKQIRTVPAGSSLTLAPSESVPLLPGA